MRPRDIPAFFAGLVVGVTWMMWNELRTQAAGFDIGTVLDRGLDLVFGGHQPVGPL